MVLSHILGARGSHFDPEMVELFFNHIDDILAINTRLAESPA